MHQRAYPQRAEHLGHARRIPLNLIASPLDDGKKSGVTISSLPFSHDLNALTAKQDGEKSSGTHAGYTVISSARRPLFKQRSEASTIELFFDLFFVANLTVFSLDHEIDDGHSVSLLGSSYH